MSGRPADAQTAAIRRFLLLYALANAGGVVAYAPLLTLLFPERMAALAGPAAVAWLSAATLAGALSASLFGLVFGWLSDVAGTRRGWTMAGLAAVLASYVLLGRAATPAALAAAVVLFQAAVNMMLAPLAAWAADAVPDERKGWLAGLIAAGPPAGALAGVAATLPLLGGTGAGLAVTCALTAAAMLPLLLSGAATAAAGRDRPPAPAAAAHARGDLVLLWTARFLVQTAAVVLFAFLLFYARSLVDPPDSAWVARLLAAASVAGLGVALWAGRVSDRLGPRRPFLAAAAAAMAGGLGVMALAQTRAPAAAGYLLFGAGLAVFLPLQATFSMQLLPRPDRRGRDLGLLNLANTLPSVAAPLLAAGLVPAYGYPALLGLLAVAVVGAGALVLAVREDAQGA